MTDANQQDQNVEVADDDQQRPGSSIPEADKQYPFGATADADQQPAAVAPNKFDVSPTVFYAVIGAGLGILLVAVFAINSLRQSSPSGPYDLGVVDSSAFGLRGHLFTKWEDKLQYRLSIEPEDAQRRAAFALAVSNSPRPFAVDIQLKDPLGFVLCSKNILLKYDPKNAPAATDAASQPGKKGAKSAVENQAAEAVDVAKLQILEQQRELGKDIFQNDIGRDGQIDSISAQGELSCSKKEYAATAYWSLLPDFLNIVEQDALLKPQPGSHAAAAQEASPKSAQRRRSAPRTIPNPSLYFVEGDDAIVDYDAAGGIISTRSGKTFFIDKAGAAANALKGRDFPIEIHYKCDQTVACTLTGPSLGVLHAGMRR